jgi:serine/threonine protein kinase
MWSLGILLYAILCGYFPFRAKNYPDLYRRIARGTFEIPEELSVNAKDLIRQLLTMDPYQRLSASAALKHPWLANQAINPADMAKLRQETPILISEKASDDIDEQVIVEMEEYGINREDLVKQILTKTHSAVATLYYLLLDAVVSQRRPGGGGNTRTRYSASNVAEVNSSANTTMANDVIGGGSSSRSGSNWKKFNQPTTYIQSPAIVSRNDSSGATLMQNVMSSRPKSASAGRSSSSGAPVSGASGSSAAPASGIAGMVLGRAPSGSMGAMGSAAGGSSAPNAGTGPTRPHSAYAGRR